MAFTFPFRHGDKFPILELIATFDWKTASSIFFMLGTESDTLDTSVGEPFPGPPGFVFHQKGSLDVHYPCEGHIKVKLQILLPEEYHRPTTMHAFVKQAFAALGIPEDETFDALFVVAVKYSSISCAVDRHGMTNRL